MTKSRAKNEVRQDLATYRVNARFDGAQADKLAFLAEATGMSTSDVLRAAIDRYYEATKGERAAKRKTLERLIGTAKPGLPTDLSENYKQYLTESLMKKHGYR